MRSRVPQVRSILAFAAAAFALAAGAQAPTPNIEKLKRCRRSVTAGACIR